MAQDPLAKSLPSNVEAERAILGAILLDNSAAATAGEKLYATDFFQDNHSKLFAAMLAMHERKEAIDLVSLTDRLHSIGQLESVGGAAYIAQLMDGVPHVSNVEHYCRIVKEKSRLRDLIHLTHAIQQQALEGSDPTSEILDRAARDMAIVTTTNGHTKPKPISLAAFLVRKLHPMKFVIDPILPQQGLALLYAWRGTGKSFVNLEMAVAVSTGGRCFKWSVPEPHRVLYVDGEMIANELQERCQQIVVGRGMKMPEVERYLEFFTPDILEEDYPGTQLEIVTRKGQKIIEDHLEPGTFLILDNLSSLGHVEGSAESESESWWPIQDWALKLRKRGITILFVHHAGKSGTQRGSSAREDLMHTIIEMKSPSDYQQHEGLRAEVHFKKSRKYKGAQGLYPFEISMRSDDRGGIVWLQKDLTDLTEQRVQEMLGKGMSVREVADDLALSRFQVYRIRDKIGMLK
jgi:DnaB-like helicase N terminal domain/AAA domain